MSNKNTKRFNKLARVAGKAGNAEYALECPTHGYHSNGSVAMRRKPTARRSKDGIVSSNARRNTAMKILHNEDGNGQKQSITVHEPLNKSVPTVFKNHTYMREDEHKHNNYKNYNSAR